MNRKRDFVATVWPFGDIIHVFEKQNEKRKVAQRRRFDLEGRLEERMKGKRSRGREVDIYVLQTSFLHSGVQFQGKQSGRVHIFRVKTHDLLACMLW